jgi:hypothetical protein
MELHDAFAGSKSIREGFTLRANRMIQTIPCPASEIPFENRPVILSEAYFSEVEGPVFLRLQEPTLDCAVRVPGV